MAVLKVVPRRRGAAGGRGLAAPSLPAVGAVLVGVLVALAVFKLLVLDRFMIQRMGTAHVPVTAGGVGAALPPRSDARPLSDAALLAAEAAAAGSVPIRQPPPALDATHWQQRPAGLPGRGTQQPQQPVSPPQQLPTPVKQAAHPPLPPPVARQQDADMPVVVPAEGEGVDAATTLGDGVEPTTPRLHLRGNLGGATAAEYAADLSLHKADAVCWQHYDLGFLDDWNQQAQTFCEPAPGGDTGSDGPASSLTCRVMNDAHLPAPTRPHTCCDGTNVGIDFNRLRKARCPRFRPGYKCGGPLVFHLYDNGALQGACDRSSAFVNGKFPKDHLRDIFASWQSVSRTTLSQFEVNAAPVALFLTRERLEHANLFHATTDFINAFEALHMAGVIDIHREGDRAGIENVQVFILDEQKEGPFDNVFDKVFSPQFPVMRVSTVDGSRRRLFRHAVFSPPGYTNFLFAHLMKKGDCTQRLQLLESFRLFVLGGMGVALPDPAPTAIRLVFISRRPYTKFVEHRFVGRQVPNEDKVLQRLNSIPRVEAQLVDFVDLTFQQQLEMVAHTDILMGMHGAALSHAVYLPPWAAVIELWPKTKDMWRCFEHLSMMSGLIYRRWENKVPRNHWKDDKGDYTRVNEQEVRALAVNVVAEVARRKADSAAP